MNQLSNKIKRWLTGCLLCFVTACQPAATNEAATSNTDRVMEQAVFRRIDSISSFIKTGDLITRTGNDFTSYCLQKFCQTDKTYSHCGIASVENDTVFVYHALGGEFNPDQKIVREPLRVFSHPFANKGVGVFRFDMNSSQADSVIAVIRDAINDNITFDMDFDLDTDDKMYCSEFTAKMYTKALQKDSLFTLSRINDFRFYAPDNLFLHPRFHTVYKVVY